MVESSQVAAIGQNHPTAPLPIWLPRIELFVFCALTFGGLIPVWATPYFPSVDGPAHVALVHVWTQYQEASASGFREFFEIDIPLVPNLFIYFFLYPFTEAFSPFVAEKILLSLYVIGFPLAVRYAVAAIDQGAKAFSVLAVPLVYNFLLNFGFYNFLFGAIVFCVLVGYWYRHREFLRAQDYVVCAGLSALAFFTHLSAIALAGIAIALLSIGEAQLVARNAAGGVGARIAPAISLILDRAGKSIIALSPGLLLVMLYLLLAPNLASQVVQSLASTPSAAAVQTAPIALQVLQRTITLLISSVLAPLAPAERLVALLYSITWFVLVAILLIKRERPGTRRFDAILFLFLGFVALYILVPFQILVRWVPDRVHLYVLIISVLVVAGEASMATVRLRVRSQVLALILVSAITVPSLLFKVNLYRQLDQLTVEFLAASEHIRPASNVLALRLKDDAAEGAELISYSTLIQGGSYFVVLNNAVDVKNVQAQTSWVPVRFRADKTVHRLWARDRAMVSTPPDLDLSGFSAAVGSELDYVVLWGRPALLQKTEQGKHFADSLMQLYELIYVSPQNGLLHVYRSRAD